MKYGYPNSGADGNFKWVFGRDNLTMLIRKKDMSIVGVSVKNGSKQWLEKRNLTSIGYKGDDMLKVLVHKKCGQLVYYYSELIVCDTCKEII